MTHRNADPGNPVQGGLVGHRYRDFLLVCDLSGRLVDEIAEGVFSAGEQTVTWTPSPALAAGCYLVRVASEGVIDTETCVLLR